MDRIIVSLKNRLREWLADMTDEQRLEVFEAIMEDYCRHCGGKTNGTCYCTADE